MNELGNMEEKLNKRREIYNNANFIVSYKAGTRMPGKENWVEYHVCDNYILVTKNGNVLFEGDNELLANQIKKVITDNIDKLESLSSRKPSYAKASSHADLTIKYNSNKYLLSALFDDIDIQNLYKRITSKISDLLTQNNIILQK